MITMNMLFSAWFRPHHVGTPFRYWSGSVLHNYLTGTMNEGNKVNGDGITSVVAIVFNKLQNRASMNLIEAVAIFLFNPGNETEQDSAY